MIDVIALILACVLIGSFGQICMKKGLENIGGIKLNELMSMKLLSTISETSVLTGLLLYGVSTLLWLVIISKADLSFAYPMIALGYVVTAFLARLYFNENITLMKWLGILLILGGVLLISKA